MPSDRSRGRDDLGQQYQAVVMQQGRVILDRDFNALQEIVDRRISADALDEIGPCGTPDNGFAISLPAGAAPVPVTRSFSGPNPLDFLIAPGTMYVGGQRVALPQPPAGAQGFLLNAQGQPSWSYFNQPDWLEPDEPQTLSGSQSIPTLEYVYLHVYEQEVSAVEDPDLLDVALGGPDTTQRVRLRWRVQRTPTTATDCPSALAQVSGSNPTPGVPTWLDRGLNFDPTTMRLLPLALLQVSFRQATTTTNPCDPTAQGGYLGAENQLLRLQIGPMLNGQQQLLWGYDNASFLYRVSVQPDGQTLNLAQTPVDAFHTPAANQTVEVLRSASIVGSMSSTPSRYVAEATGLISQVQSYNTTANSVTLKAPLPAPYLSDPQLFLRIWQGQQGFSATLASNTIVLTDPTLQIAPGVQVTITTPPSSNGGALPIGAYWMIALRPGTQQSVYPERFLNGPQPPDGPRQWVCPLAILDWQESQGSGSLSAPASSGPQAGVLSDCRQSFQNLVQLSQSKLGGCCTLNLNPSDAGDLQQLLDSAVSLGQPVKACFAPGSYDLTQPLRLGAQHSYLTLEGCNGGATLQAASGADVNQFVNGLVVMNGAENVTFRGLTLVPTAVPYPTVSGLGSTTVVLIALRPGNCRNLTLDSCRLEFAAPWAARQFVFAAGLFLAGDCTGLTVRNCNFTSQIAVTSTYTPAGFGPSGIAGGPNNKVWFTVAGPPAKVGSYDLGTTNMSLYSVPTPGSFPVKMIYAPDGNLWFGETLMAQLGRVNPTTPEVDEFAQNVTLTLASDPNFTVGPDQNLWANVSGHLVRVNMNTPTPTFTTFSTPSGNPIQYFAFSPDGNVWFTESGGTNSNIIGMLNVTTSTLTEFTFLAANSNPTNIAAGPDGNMWIIESGTGTGPFKIGVVNPKTATLVMEINVTPTPAVAIGLTGLAVVPKNKTFLAGSIWFLESTINAIGVIDLARQNAYTSIPLSTGFTSPSGIITGPDNNVWFFESGTNGASTIGMIDATTKTITNTQISTSSVLAGDFAVGPDGNLWFVMIAANKIGVINVGNKIITQIPVADTAPTFVSVIGILSLPALTFSSGDDQRITIRDIPYLTGATIQDNHFDNLTVPVLLEGGAGSVSLEDNRVTECLGGFIVWTYGSSPTTQSSWALAFKEIQLATTLGTNFVLPPGFTESRGNGQASPRLSLKIADNYLEAQPRDTGLYGTAALLICVNLPSIGAGSLLVISNDVNARTPSRTSSDPTSAPTIPAVSISTNIATAITGNVIVNVTPPGFIFFGSANSYSLWVQPSNPASVPGLAVSGNVLVGLNNLSTLTRGEVSQVTLAAPFNTWSPFNSSN